MEGPETKICNKCKIEKTLGDFDESKKQRGKLRPGCRVCNATRDTYYAANRERESARAKRALASQGREARNEYKRRHHRTRPEVVLLQNAKQRARHQGLPFDLTLDDILVPEICPILGIPLRTGEGKASPNSPSLDRVNPCLGYVRGNVIVLSHRANTLKSDATPAELRQVADFLEQWLKGAVG